MGRYQIGELEELILVVTGILGEEAYAVSIHEEIKNQTGRNVNISAIHAVLKRLESKGFVASRMGGAEAIRGGRSKRFYYLSSVGRQTLEDIREVRNRLMNQLPQVS